MDKQLENQPNPSKNSSGFNTLDIIALVSAAGGSIASIALNQVALAALPLSASIALHVFNRKQLMTQMVEAQQASQQAVTAQLSQQITTVQESISDLSQFQQKSISQLTKQTQAHQASLESLSEQIAQLQQSTANLTQENRLLNQVTENQQKQHKDLEAAVSEMREVQEITQKMSANPNSAEFYFQRGLSQERLGDKQKAIEDYNEALKIDSSHAYAYFHRGTLHKEVGQRKLAVEDLRKAAKYFLEKGDIEGYQKAKTLSQGMHNFRSAAQQESDEANNHQSDRIAVGGLFS
jgi:tetratricopeptide (TPR) repeat protein